MIIGICQLHTVWENKVENYKKAEVFIKKAALEKADIILFPEMTLTGFSMNTPYTTDKEELYLNKFRQLSIECKIYIGFGWVKDCAEKAENHYSILNPDGQIIADYTKIHPFRYAKEDQYFLAGNQLSICKIKDTYFGIAICYDLRFPEIFQKMSKKADIIIVPANWPSQRNHHWKCLLQARAVENQCYIIGINCVGQINELYYSGDSCIINPDGQVIESISDKEILFTREIINTVTDYRNTFPVRLDRREDIYIEYYK